MTQQYCVVVVEIASQRAVGVDFCKDLAELNWRADMSRRDMGEGCIVLTYPDAGAQMADALLQLDGADPLYS